MLTVLFIACRSPLPGASADTDAPADVVPQPGLLLGGVVACAEPERRDTEGPVFQPNLGADWTAYTSEISAFGAAVEDFTGDGLIDIFLPDHDGCALFSGQPDGTLSRREGALPEDCAGMGAAPADIDADGDLDILVATLESPELLLINDGSGIFTDEAAERGLHQELNDPTMGASWGDYDRDGDLDLFLANHSYRGDADGQLANPGVANRLMRNDGGGIFTDVTADTLSTAAQLGYTFLGGWHDLDMDGNPDLYIINDYGSRVYPNLLMMGDGNGTLTESDPAAGLTLAIDAMGLGVGDFSGDGRPDLAISDWGGVHLMISQEDSTWYDSTLASGMTTDHADQVVGWAMEFADPDNDADLDIFATFGPSPLDLPEDHTMENPDHQPDALWLNDGGTLTESAADWGLDSTGNNRGLVVADLNGDGWLDTLRRGILTGDTILHRSRCGAAAWISVRLQAAGENPAGIGARIETWQDGERQLRWISSGSTSLSSGGPLVAHFGLGDVDMLDRLEVFWPDGTTDAFTNIQTRQSVLIRQDEIE